MRTDKEGRGAEVKGEQARVRRRDKWMKGKMQYGEKEEGAGGTFKEEIRCFLIGADYIS